MFKHVCTLTLRHAGPDRIEPYEMLVIHVYWPQTPLGQRLLLPKSSGVGQNHMSPIFKRMHQSARHLRLVPTRPPAHVDTVSPDPEP